jgi:hypothetical protein
MEKKIFKAKQCIASCDQLLHSTPDMVFPLLCPKREYDWIETWKCEIIFSKSGFAELDCIFTTEFPGDVKETWIVDRFDINEKIQFIRFTDSRVMRYCICLFDNNNGTTRANWKLKVTSLTNEGNSYLDKFSIQEYETRIKGLEKMLNHYLTTGQMLKITK